MTKTKSQLRAEAVERLKSTHIDNCTIEHLATAIGSEWVPVNMCYSLGKLKSRLIDLLTDDTTETTKAAQECTDDEIIYGFEFCGKPDSTMLGETMFDYNGEPVGWIVGANLKDNCKYNTNISDDQEKLEEDVRVRFGDGLVRNIVMRLLDRQAAITKTECEELLTNKNLGKVYESRENDSREILEEDVSKYVHDAWAQGWEAGQHDDMDCCNFYISDMRALLDRQAAITERECADRYVNTWTEGSVAWILQQYEDKKLMRDVDCDAIVALETEELEDKIAKLQAKVDELTAERATVERLRQLNYMDVDRDPVEIMRNCGSINQGMDSLRKTLGIEYVSGWQMQCLRKLADMVERDYVSRQDFAAQYRTLCGVRKQRNEASEQVDAMRDVICDFRDERDRWKTKFENREFAYKQADAERKRYSEQIDALTAERDEWKAKAEGYANNLENQGYPHGEYMRRPIGKDGQPIHVGDRLVYEN